MQKISNKNDLKAAPVTRRVHVSLGVKISIALAMCLLVAAAATSMMATRLMRSALISEFQSKGEGISRGLATAVVALIVREDKAKVKASADEFSMTSGIAYIVLNDPTGQVLAAAIHRERSAPAPETEFPQAIISAILNKEDVQIEAKIASVQVEVPNFGRYLDMSYPIMNGALGRAHVGLDLGAIEARISELRRAILVEFGFFMLVAIFAAMLFSRILVRPLIGMMEVVDQVSTGNLRSQANVLSNDEFVLFGNSLNQMIMNLRDIVASVRLATVQVNDASEEILATARDQERAVTEQVGGVEEISQTMTALADTARAIAENTDGVTQVTQDMSEEVKRGQVALATSRESVAQIVDQNTIIVDRINKLFEQSESIIAVIDIIDNISDRLDLLALNAALEGSRAGDVGKGFSLVAAEMRRLAENVSESTKEIKGTIQQIHGLVRAALEASHAGTDRTRTGAVEMEKTVEIMSTIFTLIENTAASTQQITVITQQQVSSSQQIATAMRDVASIATQGVAAAREVSRAAADLANLSSTLQAQVAVFQVVDGDQGVLVEKT